MEPGDHVWRCPPENLQIADGEVHVWRATLDQTAERLTDFARSLTPDEKERAERFHFRQDRNHFIVARGVLRAILGLYLGIEPEQLRFRYSPYGKPALTDAFSGGGVRFNLSHSHGLAMYALTRGREIGVDLEYVRPDFASEQIAERFFSPRETAVLRALPADVRTEAFFNCWTRKEAYVKAVGMGLSLPLDQFDVSLTPGEPARLIGTPGDPPEAARWSLCALSPGPGYVGALAVEGSLGQLACWQWFEP